MKQKNGAPFAGRAVFSLGSGVGRLPSGRRSHQHMLNDSRDGEKASHKKIPAFRRANDTLFNVSERSAS
ncbi:hypothetical protein [Paraburkholderia sp. BL6665CI2N2]|uniref:hypothetical protein n=1 Tax=Paraburkholderia sp. BL6665CI2N2 TaxID=1938806 RepID=UPI0010662A84|nr:hypothetical protein [Paraburkholderia sp. BL6665CI2N2]